VKNPDDEANKALELHGLYKSVLDGLKEEEYIAIEEFCKVVYDDGEMPSLKVEGFIMYHISKSIILLYMWKLHFSASERFNSRLEALV
jgi:hypothetical protein